MSRQPPWSAVMIEAAVAAGSESVPVARRNGEPALGVENEFGNAAKQRSARPLPPLPVVPLIPRYRRPPPTVLRAGK